MAIKLTMKYLKIFEDYQNEKIYINSKLSEYFDVPYDNKDADDFIVAVNALEHNNSEWDTAHKDIFQKYRGKTLVLKGDNHGWWKILEAY